jgi:hypothetical protein
MMKKLLFVFAVLVTLNALAKSSHRVSGYTKKNGTYVQPSHATNPNGSKLDNYSSKGNSNPYTGQNGTK